MSAITTQTVVMAIDPGANGGLCVGDQKHIYTASFKSRTDEEIVSLIIGVLNTVQVDKVIIEKVHAMPSKAKGKGPRVIRMGATSAFNFGKNVGLILGALYSHGVAPEFVLPSVWQKKLGLSGFGEETTTEKKNRHKEKAIELFPSLKITHYIADAVLIHQSAYV